MRRLLLLCRNIFRKERLNQELEEELRSYVELVASEKVRHGADPEEALKDAGRETGTSRTGQTKRS